MNDWKGDVTPVLTAYGGEAYERGANITTPELRYMYPVGTLPHTYLYALSATSTATTYDFFLDPLFPLYFFAYYFIRKKDPGQAPTGPDARGMS